MNLIKIFFLTVKAFSRRGERLFGIQKPRHCGGVKKSLSGEQRKEAPNVIIY